MNANMLARVSNLAKPAEEWSKLNFVPMLGELVVYTFADSAKSPSIKIGDGKHSLHELPFVVETIAAELIKNVQLREELDAGCITDYFK